MKNNKNIHAGHRERFRKQVESTGLYNLSDLHFLEYLLMYIIPRVDTNPIAHRLLDEFKTIENIFNATPKSLSTIEGIGEKTAEFLHVLSGACYFYNKSKYNKNVCVKNFKSLINYINAILPPSTNEQFVIIIVGKNLEVKNYKIFNGISHSYIKLDAKEISEFLIKHKTSFCIMAHTHPENSANPSDSDIDTFYSITPLLNSLGISLLENIILGENNFYSFKQESLIKYSDIESTCLESFKYTTKDIKEKFQPKNVVKINASTN